MRGVSVLSGLMFLGLAHVPALSQSTPPYAIDSELASRLKGLWVAPDANGAWLPFCEGYAFLGTAFVHIDASGDDNMFHEGSKSPVTFKVLRLAPEADRIALDAQWSHYMDASGVYRTTAFKFRFAGTGLMMDQGAGPKPGTVLYRCPRTP